MQYDTINIYKYNTIRSTFRNKDRQRYDIVGNSEIQNLREVLNLDVCLGQGNDCFSNKLFFETHDGLRILVELSPPRERVQANRSFRVETSSAASLLPFGLALL